MFWQHLVSPRPLCTQCDNSRTSMVLQQTWTLLSLTATICSIEIKYAVIGACVGAILAVSFIALKLYMIKKHMLDNNFADSESFNRRAEMDMRRH
ncbi:transmembrane protein 273 isoform X2 [Bombina bombina]|uniref:transmembrane protein 273 isoform X2 n=1 Tax=Bombina bombina TaxID=8345 RepID=UPI00235A8313|nr:transmembrane protein 273 isoform X2 [Bombina bombina]